MAAGENIAEAAPGRPPAHWLHWLLIALGGLLGLLLAVLLCGYAWLGTDSGRRFVARQVSELNFASGLKIEVGKVEGSVFGHIRIHDFALRDPRGTFLTAPLVDLDWTPLRYLANHVDVHALRVPDMHLYRAPQLRPTPPSNGPILPNLDIDVDRLEIGRLRIDPPVTGRAHLLGLSGNAHIADGRAQMNLQANALRGAGISGGDRLTLKLDAVPQDNKLDVSAHVTGPADGMLAAMSGIGRPFDLTLSGEGDWSRWDGQLTGHSGPDSIADIALGARDGTFSVSGSARPAPFLTGSWRQILSPAVDIRLTARAQARRVRLNGGLGSNDFRLSTTGVVDLGRNEARDLTLSFHQLGPAKFTDNVAGKNIAATVRLDGPFAAPRIDYQLTANRLDVSTTHFAGLSVTGSAAMSEDQWKIPVRGHVDAITGVNPAIAGLLHNVRLDGNLSYANGRLLSDDLRLRSDRIDAKAIVVADMKRSLYTGALQGRVAGYEVPGLGRFDLDTRADLKSGANGAIRLVGHVDARSTRLDSGQLHALLGGNAHISSDFGYGSDGGVSVDRLQVVAPGFRMAGASARYAPGGAIRLTAHATSRAYGDVGVEARGTLARPHVRFAATRPGLGVGLSRLEGRLDGRKGGYDLMAQGASDYGPLKADVGIDMARGGTRIDVRQGTAFAGVGIKGAIRQTSAGPFDGRLALDGAGINGILTLANASGVQQAHVKARVQDARFPGAAQLAVGRAIVDADVMLEAQPRLVGDVQIANARYGSMHVEAARADIDYRGGQGQAKLLVNGRTQYPFRLAANARFDTQLWRLALDGRFNGIAVATGAPLRIVPNGSGYQLLPSTLTVGKGTLQLAGRYGGGALSVQSRLDKVDLALANPFLSGLGIGGMASGSLDFSQAGPSAFPHADGRLSITRFTRTGVAVVSEPVDIAMVGRLLPDGGEARALVRRRGAVVGRLQVDLKPLPPGAGSWTTRLLAAPLSGGIRYNGPADTLFSLTALPDQSLTGAIGVAADFSGRVRSPQLTGRVLADHLTYENSRYGTRLTDLHVSGRFTNDRLQVDELTAKAGRGTISGKGFVSLSASQGFPVQLGLNLDRAQLANGQDLSTQVSGQLQIVNSADQPATIKGKISLPETHYQIVREGSAQVKTLTGVHHKLPPGQKAAMPPPVNGLPADWKLDVDVVADNAVFVTGMGLNSEWGANMHIGGTTGDPVITGGIHVVRGTLGFAGHSFDLQKGDLRFEGGAVSNPSLNIVASGDVEDVTIDIDITGTGDNPQIAFTSTPALPQDELMSRILFGNSVGQLSAIQAVQLASSLNALRGSGGGLNPLGVLQSSTGIDRIRILGSDKTTGRGTSLAVGQYITNDVYVELVTDARGYTATQIEIDLTRALSILSATSSFGNSSIALRYKKDY